MTNKRKNITDPLVYRLYPELVEDATPSERIAAIYRSVQHSTDYLICQEAIAAHPNTPPEILAQLLGPALDGFLCNPRLPLILLENPDFWNQQYPAYLLQMLVRADIPDYLIIPLTYHLMRRSLRQHVCMLPLLENRGTNGSRKQSLFFRHFARDQKTTCWNLPN